MKYYFSFLLTLVSFLSFAQVISTQPASFTAEEKVKIIIDVTGTSVAGIEPLYIWTWAPNEPPIPGGNGQWTSSNDSLKLTKEAENVWSITMVPVNFYKTTAAKVSQISFLVKAKDGSGSPEKKTGDLSVKVDPIAYKDSLIRAFPSKFTEKDIVAFYYNRALEKNKPMKSVGATDAGKDSIYVFAEVKVKNTAGVESNTYKYALTTPALVGTNEALKATNIAGTELYRIRFIPRKFFNIPDGETITKIKVQFRSKDGTKGSNITSNPSDNIEFNTLK